MLACLSASVTMFICQEMLNFPDAQLYFQQDSLVLVQSFLSKFLKELIKHYIKEGIKVSEAEVLFQWLSKHSPEFINKTPFYA